MLSAEANISNTRATGNADDLYRVKPKITIKP
jgi:hypothetical protein